MKPSVPPATPLDIKETRGGVEGLRVFSLAVGRGGQFYLLNDKSKIEREVAIIRRKM
jgi:hypothetical protein